MSTGTQKVERDFEEQTQTGQHRSETFFDSGQENQANSKQSSTEDQVELKYRSPENIATAKLAKGLGIFSIALGLAEVLAPAQIGELIGVSQPYRAFIPALGLREIVSGIGILYQAKPTASVWSRVGGDAVDLAFLGAAFLGEENNKRRLLGATAAVLGVAALDVMCAQALSAEEWSDVDGNLAAPTTIGQSSARQALSS